MNHSILQTPEKTALLIRLKMVTATNPPVAALRDGDTGDAWHLLVVLSARCAAV